MLDLTPYGRLAELTKLTDKLISDASKDAVAEAARMLAIQLGHYARKFGVIPLDESLLESETLGEEQAGWVADALEHLAVALATIKDEDKPPTAQ